MPCPRKQSRDHVAVVRVKSEITSSLDVCRPRIDFDKRARRIAETGVPTVRACACICVCVCVFSKRNAQRPTPAHARVRDAGACDAHVYVRARTRRVRVFSKAARAPVYHFITVMGETTRATDAAITVATATDASGCYTTGDNRWHRHFGANFPETWAISLSFFRPTFEKFEKDSKLF